MNFSSNKNFLLLTFWTEKEQKATTNQRGLIQVSISKLIVLINIRQNFPPKK
ncbi:hypothetical protein llh_13920 (plasmid) [Lactococcus cremoris subsp. cremoris A76]|nr:hypothetical protein llh_13920 [Lactococcus cremoris subsp. cremoris A76]